MFVFQILSRQFISYAVGSLAHGNAGLIVRLALPPPHPVLWELGVAPRVSSPSLSVCVCMWGVAWTHTHCAVLAVSHPVAVCPARLCRVHC